MHTYEVKIAFEEFPAANGDRIDGHLIVEFSCHDWEVIGAEVFAGRNGMVLVRIADHDLISQMAAYFKARPGWVEIVDIEHEAYFPRKSRRTPRLVPAWAE